jgi:demethylmenaquinone methyltransferase / 2-methoxy-6-polyprenyl-1,4-benzoquinol methylase
MDVFRLHFTFSPATSAESEDAGILFMEKTVFEKYPQVKEISDAQRIRMVKEIFSTITGKYDFLNRFLSLRRDVYWRNFAAKKMNFFMTNRYLDVACGTGDLSIAASLHHPQIHVTGVDFVPEMVAVAQNKIQQKNLAGRITVMQGDALHLPFEDNFFDATGIAFGIRNIPDRSRALAEMLRVTVPGGQIMVLEMTFVQNRFFKFIYYIYLNFLLPSFAKLFSKNPAAYYYLADSIMNFPNADDFVKIMENAGMVEVKKYPLTFGITWLHLGKKAN